MARYYSDPEFRDEVITKAHQRRASRLGVPGVVNLRTLINYLMDRDDGICKLCRRPVSYEDASPDHKVPLSKGGEHVIENLQLSHLVCNLRKGNRWW
jgi:HNH endonuclease